MIVKPRRLAQAAAIALGLLVLAGAAGTVVLDTVIHTRGTGGPVVESLSVAVAATPAIAVSVLLAARRPRNPIGWLLFGILITGGTIPTTEYDVFAYRLHRGDVPLAWVSVVLQECWPLFLVLVAILLWVFPDGKLPGGRWRRPSVILLVVGLAFAVATSSSGLVIAAGHHVRIAANGDLANLPGGVFVFLYITVLVLALAAWLAWLVIQIPAYRQADGERRQQLKWLYSGAAVTLAGFGLGVFVIPLALGESPGYGTNPAVQAFLILAFGALPACLGVAVMKYRLYELDRIISRVVSYTLITALLGGVFAGLILLATYALPSQDSVSVAVSTLITAALFTPLRRRVQRVVDRRFNRSRYNAEAVVAAFTARLRHTIDLDLVQQDLVDVVDEAFQPTQVAMWLVPRPELPLGLAGRGQGARLDRLPAHDPPPRLKAVGGATLARVRL